ncbi:MAG: Phospholipase D/Transphosphatidylase [Rhodocyclaceae bacterium]|nr:Phospholipase D/Transphosphatidylase [Rhodocyclaceae bacterium]
MPLELLYGNRLILLNSGREYFPALLAALQEAQQEIHLESYIFADDAVGNAVAGALAQAALRGVQVRVLVDGFGGRNFLVDFEARLTAAGAQVMLYRRELARFRMRRHRLRRLHRKLVVVDGRIAFVGGINIVDDNNTPGDLGPRYDYAVRAEGPVVAQIHAAVRRMWEIVAWANLRRRFRLQPCLQASPPPSGEQPAAFLLRDNFRHRNDIANAYLEAIHGAREEILIANAYFLPGFRFRHALRDAAQRGVRITILLQGVSDHPLLRYATGALHGALVEDGIRVFEYRKSFLHAKVAVVDGLWATVGSSNIDPFSLLLAKEGNIFAWDRPFAAGLRASLLEAMAEGAREIGAAELHRMPMYSRLLRWLSYGLVRLLVGLAGYGPKHWQANEEKPEVSRR